MTFLLLAGSGVPLFIASLVIKAIYPLPVHYKRRLSFSMLLLKEASTEEEERKGCMLYVSFGRVRCQRRERRRGCTLCVRFGGVGCQRRQGGGASTVCPFWWSWALGEVYFNASEFCSWFFR